MEELSGMVLIRLWGSYVSRCSLILTASPFFSNFKGLQNNEHILVLQTLPCPLISQIHTQPLPTANVICPFLNRRISLQQKGWGVWKAWDHILRHSQLPEPHGKENAWAQTNFTIQEISVNRGRKEGWDSHHTGRHSHSTLPQTLLWGSAIAGSIVSTPYQRSTCLHVLKDSTQQQNTFRTNDLKVEEENTYIHFRKYMVYMHHPNVRTHHRLQCTHPFPPGLFYWLTGLPDCSHNQQWATHCYHYTAILSWDNLHVLLVFLKNPADQYNIGLK